MYNLDTVVSTHSIDGCDVHCIVVWKPNSNYCDYIRVEIINPTSEFIKVDLSKMRLKLNDWYYSAKWLFSVDACSRASGIVTNTFLEPVDNLTGIEELAKERNLI